MKNRERFLDEARKTAVHEYFHANRAISFANIAAFTKEEKDFAEARENTRGGPLGCYWTICGALAKAYAEIGYIKEARAIAKRINRLASNFSEVCGALAKAYAEIGDIKEARAIAEEIVNASDRVKAYVAIAKVTHEKEDIDRARAAAGGWLSEYHSALSIAAIAEVTGSEEDVRQARAIAEEIVNASDRVKAYVAIAKVTHEKEDIDRARAAAASELKHCVLSCHNYAAIASVTGDDEDIAKIRDAVEKMSFSRVQHDIGRLELVETYAGVGNFNRAYAVAKEISPGQWRSAAFLALAKAFGENEHR